MGQSFCLGIDIGSTTVKVLVINQEKTILFSQYERHYSEVTATVVGLLKKVDSHFPDATWHIALAGSGALALGKGLEVAFIQEVLASSRSIREIIPDADVAIELGGEDAKLTFFQGGLDQRMNETCAGGTGAFIDQMAAFIQTDAKGLDLLASRHSTIYPIASRCGVFAKTDILPLLNQGSSREDIAASIMQAVVNQTISGLARGREIKGKVVFLGGPLTFLPTLLERFTTTLGLTSAQAILPAYSEYFVALGAALFAQDKSNKKQKRISDLVAHLERESQEEETYSLPPLFSTAEDYWNFYQRHARKTVPCLPLEDASGEAWLGFDSGSTTIKAVVIDKKGQILYSSYAPNRGDPLGAAINIVQEIYAVKRPDLVIRGAVATGYGSALLSAGLRLDLDEVETIAHLVAARFFCPEVSFILDIGGQDIKCLSVEDGAIGDIQLNEACSAGCGSFIESFASSLGLALAEFVDLALQAKRPVDLGTRCTVFMNSKVKQCQKEGASIGDIAAGLCYAVVRNACYKVLKLKNSAELGSHVVVQGGAFLNDGLLRALELELGQNVVRPGLSGLMGAFGAALIAQEKSREWKCSSLIKQDALMSLTVKTSTARCKLCANCCLLTVTKFSDNRSFISGNRCEKGARILPKDVPNCYAYKYKRLFESYTPLPRSAAQRGLVGIPRALNMYENYPLWFTFFTQLGFRVELSSPSSKELFFSGYETIPSQTVCYPAKLAHGHVIDLANKNVDAIFFPCIPFEQKDFSTQVNTYNCPVVIGYPELLARNINVLSEKKIPFIHDFLPLSRDVLAKRLMEIPFFSNISIKELQAAVEAGFDELAAFKKDMHEAGMRALLALEAKGAFGIVLAGHPYHADPGIHHGIAEVIVSCGMGVLTEDSIAHLRPDAGVLRAVDQWTYHARLYRAGAFVADSDNLAVLQLVSFGCGLDAITTDQLHEIVARKKRLYAQIKIDEGANLGPARIRIRSLLAALEERRKKNERTSSSQPKNDTPPYFTEEMKNTHTILIPQLSPIHFQFLEAVFSAGGYKTKQLPQVDRAAIELGLRYVNNDACFPAIVVVGQLLQAIQSGAFDTKKIAVLISETGGGCRATNYIALLKKALVDSGLAHVPIASFFVKTKESTTGFTLPGKVLRRAIMAGTYGDTLMRLLHRVRPYEKEPGSTMRLVELWAKKGKKCIASGNIVQFDWTLFAMIRAFGKLPLRAEKRRPRVGLVGEILLKYHPDANNEAAKIVEEEGGEAVVPDLMDFVLYCFYEHVFSYKHLEGSWKKYMAGILSIKILEFCRWSMSLGLRLSSRFSPPTRFRDLREKARGLVSLGHQTGEGWLLTAEMVKLLESGVSHILCMQPFGCLPNHITGKGVLKELKARFPEANILAIDYDPGASEVNQINRIKLMMSTTKR